MMRGLASIFALLALGVSTRLVVAQSHNADRKSQPPKKLLSPELVVRASPRSGGKLLKLTWRPGSDELAFLKTEGSAPDAKMKLVLHNAATSKERELPEPSGGKPINLPSYEWSPKGDKLLVIGGSDLWLLDLNGRRPQRLTDDPEDKEEPTFSPTGDRVAFVENNNIFSVELATGLLKKLTTDGNQNLMNGKLDWVYEEELAQLSTGRAYEWSPDGKSIRHGICRLHAKQQGRNQPI
jgi:Tol biopolymer transport system component